MSQHVLVEIEVPTDLNKFQLPKGVDGRFQDLLGCHDKGEELKPAERIGAEGLVNLADVISLLRLRTQKVWREGSPG